MKAVVLEIRGAHAAVLQEDGVIVKVEKEVCVLEIPSMLQKL